MLKKHTLGFTLVEVLIGTAVFIMITMSIYETYFLITKTIRSSRIKSTATALLIEQFEIIRNLSYSNINTTDDISIGKIPATQKLIRQNIEFILKTSILNIDDPFDGTADGVPSDPSSSDYKLVEIEINCESCNNFKPFTLTTYIAP
jgi:type II secretory pathway pseudopilin PulG